MMRKTTFVLCAMLTGLALTTVAGAAAVKSPMQSTDEAIRQNLGVTEYTLQNLELPAGPGAPFFTVATIDGIDFTLDLYPHSVRGDGFMLLVQDDSGALNRVEPPAPRTLRGNLLEVPESTVAGSLLESGLSVSILMADGTGWTIEPLRQVVAGAARATHVVYRDSDISLDGQWKCGVDASLLPTLGEADPGQGGPAGPDGTGVMLTDLAIDADWELYSQWNGSSLEGTVADVENVVNRVNTVYERDVEVIFELTTLVVRTSQAQNPYTSSNNQVLLNQFVNHWNANHGDIQRDVAHLLTGRNVAAASGGVIGTANGIGNICGSSYSFAQTHWTGNILGRVALSAHEIGHNYNGFHCNQANPPQFPCNIMCSGLGGCNGVGLPNFGPWNITRMVLHRNSRNCLQDLFLPRELPFTDNFPNTRLGRGRWSYEKGTSINDTALNEPSGTLSIQLDTASAGNEYDDELRSNFILMAGAPEVIVRYWTQHRGVESGEELIVDYRTNANEWRELKRITSDGVDQDEFDFHQHRLRANNAYHDRFRLRFRTEVDQRNDNFYIDSIRVAADPFYRISVESVGVTELPVQVWPAAFNGNTDGITPFSRSYVENAPLRLTAPAEHQGEQFVEWTIDGTPATSDLTLETTVTSAFTAAAVYGGASCEPCDMNCDTNINALDIEFFIDLLFNGADPCCGERGEVGSTGDVNGDGNIDALDIEGFINCLFP